MSLQGDYTAGTVLLLEDEPMIALDVEDTLLEAGYFDVRTISSCSDAAAWLEHGEPAVVIVDPHLRDGMCDAVVRSLVERGIPFVVHSGDLHSLAGREPAFAHGLWLSKPAPPAKIIDAVAMTLRGPRA